MFFCLPKVRSDPQAVLLQTCCEIVHAKLGTVKDSGVLAFEGLLNIIGLEPSKAQGIHAKLDCSLGTLCGHVD